MNFIPADKLFKIKWKDSIKKNYILTFEKNEIFRFENLANLLENHKMEK